MFVTLQLNAIDVAGDWATRSAGCARIGTGAFGRVVRSAERAHRDSVAVQVAELRGVVDSMKRGAHSPDLATTRTEDSHIRFGTPLLYRGMRFAVSA